MKKDWTYKKLGEVTTAKITDLLWFQEGPGVRKNQYTEDGVKLLNVANLVNGTVDLSTSSRYISEEEAYGKYKHFLVDEGDLIIASSGIQVSYFDKKMGFVTADQLPLCMNTSTIRFKVLDESITDIKYFMYYLKSFPFKRQLAKYITGSAQLNFGPSHLKQMSMPLYPLAIQRSIVSELDLLHSLIEKKQEQLRALDNLAQSLFYQMFGDPITNPMGWEIKKLGEVAEAITGITYKPADVAESGTIVLRSGNIQNGEIDLNDIVRVQRPISDKYFVQEGDILMCSRNGSFRLVGKAAKIPAMSEKMTWGAFMTIIRSEINPYILAFLRTPAFRVQLTSAKTTTVNQITIGMFSKIPLPLPPLSLQQSFAAKVSAIEAQKRFISQSIKEVESLLAQRMDHYFG